MIGNHVRRSVTRFRLSRRLRVQKSGWVVCCASVLLGLSAIATGNNLLFLMLGGLLGLIALSGWMSEQALRSVEVRRRLPGGITAGSPARLAYEVVKRRGRLTCHALELCDDGISGRAFLPVLELGVPGRAAMETVFPSRGVYRLDRIVLSTGFPFGLFSKERDVEQPGEVLVWPRLTRRVREARVGGRRREPVGASHLSAPGTRGEYRGLRDYRAGDDPRDVHWRSSARRAVPVVREYERDSGESVWICLDLRAPTEDEGEIAVEMAAAFAARACERGEAIGLQTPDERVEVGAGSAQLKRILDALARARMRPAAPAVGPPQRGGGAMLVTTGAAPAGAWDDVISTSEAG